MSDYKARITETADGSFYAMVVRVDDDGYVSVISHYKARHFKTRAAAEKSTAAYIAKIDA